MLQLAMNKLRTKGSRSKSSAQFHTMTNLASEVLEEIISLLEQGSKLAHRLTQGLVRHTLPEQGKVKHGSEKKELEKRRGTENFERICTGSPF